MVVKILLCCVILLLRGGRGWKLAPFLFCFSVVHSVDM